MAKFFHKDKWRKRSITALSFVLVATLSLGITACTTDDDDDDDDTSVSATDTQTIKNGNFEFYDEMDEEDAIDRLDLINSPDSWSFTSGSPSSTTSSGIVDTQADAWADMTRTGGYAFSTYTYEGENSTYDGEEVTTFTSISDAVTHWSDDGVSNYDRLYFLEIYEDDIDELDDDDDDKTFFDDYDYAVDYEDVQYLTEVADSGSTLKLHDGVAEDETNVLMIHNLVTSNSVVGTAQYYTSSTTITLSAGTAAEVSVWVRTDMLYHYAASSDDSDNPTTSGTEVGARAGAYIGVTNTVGGTTLDQMQIKNINTDGEWQQYTVYVRASTYAESTFKIVLGLGQGSSTDRYEHVNGYAFFDDLTCKIISAEDYEDAVGTVENPESGVGYCTLDSTGDEKIFSMDGEGANGVKYANCSTFALDLYAGFDADKSILNSNSLSIGLTEEVSGMNTYTTLNKFGKGDDDLNYTKVTSLSQIATDAASNKYLSNVYENDLNDQYPFGDDNEEILLLMSSNGAAYTAKSDTMSIAAGSRILISFFVKTSSIPTDCSGASASIVEIVDGADINTTTISAFDSTTIATVDIDDETTDIYNGWVQCFFFIENDLDTTAYYRVELSYGSTSIVGSSATDFSDGYAAFTNFETKQLTKTEYSYVTTGNQAVEVTLTGETEETRVFDEISAVSDTAVETGYAIPANFTGTVGGSTFVGGTETTTPSTIYSGLLNYKYAQAYYESTDDWKNVLTNGSATDGDDWWTTYFGNARQPLVISSTEAYSYGYLSETLTVSSSSYYKISMRVRVSSGAVAYIYLTDASSVSAIGSLLTPSVPSYTYWYNDYGDICSVDPTSDDYNAKTDILFELQENGLYLKVGDTSGTYYANFASYSKDEYNNLVTADDVIAYYYNEDDGKYYAYYDEDTQVYSQVVEQLPTTDDDGNSILRYDYSATVWDDYGTCIVVDNRDGSLTTDWITVSFFVATGDEGLTYRLEVWSGSRDGSVKSGANSYVAFDNYINEDVSSDYDTLLSEAVDALKLENNLTSKDNLASDVALYYTFTYYDSDFYLRYDINEDEDEVGNPYGSYTQSSYEEQLIYLYVDDSTGELLGSGAAYSMFLDYTVRDTTVEEDDLTEDEEDDTTTSDSDTNIWLLLSSFILAAVLLVVIVIVLFRRLLKRFGKKRKPVIKAKDKRFRPSKNKPAPETTQESEEKEEPKETKDNPYDD